MGMITALMQGRAAKHSKYSILLCSMFVLQSMSVPSLAQAPPAGAWEALNNAGKAALQSGKFPEAEAKFKAGLEALNKAAPTDSRRIETLGNLADTYNKLGNNEQSESFYKQAVALAEKASGQNSSSNLAGCLNNLAALYYKTNRLADAELLMLRALALDEKVMGATGKGLVTPLANLIELYKAESKPAEVEAAYKRIVTIWEKNAPDSADLAASLDALAGYYRSAKRPAESEALDKRALAILEKKFGAESVKLLPCLGNLGNTYKALNKFDEAEAQYKRALAISEKTSGGKGPELARSCRNLAKLYKSTQKFAEAEELYKRTISLDEASAASKDDLIKDLQSYGDMLRKNDREDEALQMEAKADAIKLGPAASSSTASEEAKN